MFDSFSRGITETSGESQARDRVREPHHPCQIVASILPVDGEDRAGGRGAGCIPVMSEPFCTKAIGMLGCVIKRKTKYRNDPLACKIVVATMVTSVQNIKTFPQKLRAVTPSK
jgi:hypothetical protein